MASKHWRRRAALTVTVGFGVVAAAFPPLRAAEVQPPQKIDRSPTTRPVTPKPLSGHVKKGLAWLAKHQLPDGGWSQGESSLDQYRQGEVGDRSNVADTCMAALALLRAGSTPGNGEYAANILGAVNFVCGQVEKAPQEGLFITDIKGSRVQTKLGQYIDTFAAALLLAEVKDAMPDSAGHKRVMAALDKTICKIEKNQKEDGRWADARDGWASALCQSVATKAVNRAVQAGASVNPQVVERAREFAVRNFDAKSGAVGGDGSANVELYARASNLEAFQDSAITDAGRKTDLDRRASEANAELVKATAAASQPAATPQQVADADKVITRAETKLREVNGQLGAIRQNQEALDQAQGKIIDRLDDKQFIAGFGSNGGEEFLSYLHIGESLALKGGQEFDKFDKGMTENLNRIQNEDGSWSGQHCITGRTFCTAAALMVLTVDRSVQAPVAQGMKSDK